MRRRGFTLIEILVVVAIIALLIAVLIPTLARARDKARSVKCMANMKDMSNCATTFSMSHRNRFQLVTTNTGRNDEDPDFNIYVYDQTQAPWQLMVWPAVLLKESGIRNLKTNADWGIQTQAAAAAGLDKLRRFETMLCPGDKIQFGGTHWPVKWWGRLSYGISEDFAGARSTGTANTVWKEGVKNGGTRLAGRFNRVFRPDTTLFLCDAGSGKPAGQQDDALNLITTVDCFGPFLEFFENKWSRFDDTVEQQPFERHLYGSRRGGMNILYIDGHAGFVRREGRRALAGTAPNFEYLPKVRVSPYKTGVYPQ